ncbi:MAG TPA: adenosylcobinamide-GDP ribazoletransferase [Actinomycetes bacterium]|nr:adenosylcobinamide-GDP ribazoletransferase [Actinomycetes bacterium]
MTSDNAARRGASLTAGIRLAVGLLTAIPVRTGRVDRTTAGIAMMFAPWVGLGLGFLAGLVSWLTLDLWPGTLLPALLAITALAILTRALHLDGLADTADGFGSGKPAPEALAIMKASDIGPFGVVALVLVLLAQISAFAAVLDGGAELTGLMVPALTGRLALTWACRTGVPAARAEGLGALVAGTVAWPWPVLMSGVGLLAAVGVALLGAVGVVAAVLAVVAGLAAAEVLLQLCVRRFGGITGDVLGALVEIATLVALLVLAV